MLSDYAVAFYKQLLTATSGRVSYDQKKLSKKPKSNSQPFEDNRDPIKLSAGLDEVIGQFDWSEQLSKAELFVSWADIVGSDVANACSPTNLANGILHIDCNSTAWATQMRLMQSQVLAEVNNRYPNLQIREIKFHSPQAPSWRKGNRSVPGRGPRDTYG
jgi:predicted nucleic acid-binding Zn ribbon protein